MSLTLGEKLRKSREERGISISEVAEQTRISPHYLKSIENDDYKPLPGGIFNKGFIKSFARYVGLDENEAVQDYVKAMGETEEQEAEIPKTYRPEVLTDDRVSSSVTPTIVFAVIILALMTGGILFVVNYLQNRGNNAAANPTPVTQAGNSTTNTNAANTAVAEVPPSDKINVELKAITEPVWISYSVDGSPKIQTLAPDEVVKLEPKDTFKISYSRAKGPNLQISVNGKTLARPTSEGKGTIEFEVNKANLQQIIQSGEIASSPTAPAKAEPAASPRHTPEPERTPAKTPRPSPNTTTPAPRFSPTPIIIGKPTPTKRPN